MLKLLQIALLGAGLTAIGNGQPLMDEEEIVETEEGEELETIDEAPEFNASVVISKYEHGKIEADILEGYAGDICVLTANPSLLYKVEYVSVNGTNLVEDESTNGKFAFALAEGENVIDASFIVDEEVCGSMTDIVKEAEEHDWEDLFSLNNVFTIIKWVLDGGILIAVIRYFVKDKKLAKKVEEVVSQTVKDIIPENTQQAVLTTLENTIEPLFNKLALDNEETKNALKAFAKCMALAQEGTPESKLAIIDELSKIKVSDILTNEKVKEFINESASKLREEFTATLASINNISEANKKIIEEQPQEETIKKVF